METAIRWSPWSTAAEQRFLYVDVLGRSFKLCSVTSYNNHTNHIDRSRSNGIRGNGADAGLSYKVLSSYYKVPAFRAYDWSPTVESVVAVGQSSGETTVLKIDGETQDSIVLPIRNQRYCNSIAFSTQSLLASGLDKVRNDFCLNIWDLNQRNLSSVSAGGRGFGSDRHTAEPLRKLASSDAITSIKFFKNQPDTLVAGVKGQFVRIYDLREGGGSPSLQFPTRCVHNIAIDSLDENYIASCLPGSGGTICVWDRRSGSRFTSATPSTPGATDSGLKPALEFQNVTDHTATLWSLRFSRTTRGFLSTLSSAGHFKAYDIAKEYVSEENRASLDQTLGQSSAQNYPEQIYAKHVRDVRYPYHHHTRGCSERQRVVSFDCLNVTTGHGPSVLTLTGDGKVDIITYHPPPPPRSLSSQGCLVQGGADGTKDFQILDPNTTLPIADVLMDIRERASAAKNAPRKLSRVASSEKIPDEKNGEQRVLNGDVIACISSREIRERELSVGTWGVQLSTLDALKLMTVYRRRCKEGYLFDSARNKRIVGDDHCLQNLWDWIGRARISASDDSMVYQGVDLNYIGVYNVWNTDLGKADKNRRISGTSHAVDVAGIIKGLVQELDLPEGKMRETGFAEQRRLCLRICGAAESVDDLRDVVERLVSQRRHTKAAALAVFQDEAKLAYLALRNNGPTQAHKLLAMAIAGAAKGETDVDWEEMCSEIAKELTDPYARAILALVSKGDWNSVIQETTLPLRYRVEVALRWLPDGELITYLRDVTLEAVQTGDVEGIVLTGLGHVAMDLFQTYIVKFNDIQTPVLAMSHTVPRFVSDPTNLALFESWCKTYRWLMNSWKLQLERAKFDVMARKFAITWDGRKLIKPPPQQVSLTCNYCTKPLAQQESASSSTAEATSGEVIHPTPGNPLTPGPGTMSGTVCPRCGRHMPRCGVCSLWLGAPDPMSRAAIATEAAQGEDYRPSEDEVMRRFVVFCINCNHGYHADHARDWFKKHRICPVAECGCLCDRR